MTEGGKHLGYMPVGVFASVESAEPVEPERQVPVRITTRGQDLMLFRRGPAPVAVRISGQGTAQAVGLFRSGLAERQDYCSNSVGDSRAEKNRCLAMYKDDDDFPVRADCENRLVTVLSETYRLHHRPATFPADGNIDPDRKWLWRDVANDEWLDGTTASGEPTVDTAFDALCPGRRPDANHGLVLRDPKALYPPGLQGVWTTSGEVCERARRARSGQPVEGALTIQNRAVQGYEYREELNQLRRLDGQGWTADVSWSGEGDGGQTSVGYRLLGETLLVTNGKTTQHFSRCR